MSATTEEILNLELAPDNEAGVKTVREYLKKLLTLVWTEEEGFSGKRPFGNSGWKTDFDWALIKAGLVRGYIDPEDGWVENVDDEAVDRLILAAIAAL